MGACTSCLPSLQIVLSAGTQVSGGFGGFGSAAVPGGDAAGQMPVGGGGAAGWGDGGCAAGGRSMARLSATQLDSLRRDAGLPSVKSLSSDQSVCIFEHTTVAPLPGQYVSSFHCWLTVVLRSALSLPQMLCSCTSSLAMCSWVASQSLGQLTKPCCVLIDAGPPAGRLRAAQPLSGRPRSIRGAGQPVGAAPAAAAAAAAAGLAAGCCRVGQRRRRGAAPIQSAARGGCGYVGCCSAAAAGSRPRRPPRWRLVRITPKK